MANYENQICEAIDVIAGKKIQDANFNSMIKAEIVECTNSNLAEYKVRYQDSEFTAYALGKYIKYKSNTLVYILVPNNDFTERKIIVGSVLVNGKSLASALNGRVDEDNYLEISLSDI